MIEPTDTALARCRPTSTLRNPEQPLCPVSGKQRYTTPLAAERVLAHIVVHSRKLRVPCRAYWCKACDGWHLTSRPRAR